MLWQRRPARASRAAVVMAGCYRLVGTASRADASYGRKGGVLVIAAIPRAAKNRSMQTVLIVLFDDVQSLDVTGPAEVFNGAELHCPGTYRIRTVSRDGRAVRTSSGLTLVPDHSFADAPPADTLVVPGGAGTRHPDPR